MNLLKETLDILEKNSKTEQDVLWVGTKTHKTTWDNFKAVSNIEYSGIYSDEVVEDLLLVGIDWWLERDYNEISGSYWVFKTLPAEPYNIINLKAVTPKQARELGIKCEEFDDTLLTINGIK